MASTGSDISVDTGKMKEQTTGCGGQTSKTSVSFEAGIRLVCWKMSNRAMWESRGGKVSWGQEKGTRDDGSTERVEIVPGELGASHTMWLYFA